MNYNRDEVRKLEREIEETSGNRFRPYRVGGGTVSEDLVVRIAEKCVANIATVTQIDFYNMKGYASCAEDVQRQVESAIREALEPYKQAIRDLFGEQDPTILAKALREIAPDSGLGNPPRKYPLTTTDVAIVKAEGLAAELERALCSEWKRADYNAEAGAQNLITSQSLRSRLAEVEKERDAQWVSVEERLPENQDYSDSFVPLYLVLDKDGYALAERYDNEWWGEFGVIREVTHWRPLPEPPGAALGRDKGMEGK